MQYNIRRTVVPSTLTFFHLYVWQDSTGLRSFGVFLSQHAAEKTVEWPVIWDAMMLMWHNCSG